MPTKHLTRTLFAAVAAMPLVWSAGAEAGCVTKAAIATAPTKAQAQWFAMETIVQQVSWGLWPGWVATGEIAGHVVKRKKYSCKADGVGTTCKATAKICTTG